MPNQKKILIVAESIDLEDSSGSKANVALIYNLHKIGYDIQVHHYTRKEINLSNIPCFLIKENKRSLLYLLSRTERQLRNNLKIDFHKSLEKIFGFSFTLFNDRNSIVSAVGNLKDFKPNLVITLSKGGSFRPHHALLGLPNFHDKWLAYIHDPYPMHLYPRPYTWIEPGYYIKWKFMKAMADKAAFPAFPSELLKEWMGSFFKGYSEKGVIIPHQVMSINYPQRRVPNYFSQDKFTILHAGNLLNFRDPKGLVEGMKLFLKRNKDAESKVQLIFVGAMSGFFDFLKKEETKMPEVFAIKGKLSFESVNDLQRLVTVNVILEAKSEISPFLPGKFPHCIIADKPILLLGPYYSESRRLLGESYEYWSEIDDVEKIASHIENLYNKWLINKRLELRRYDLLEYLSPPFLKLTIDNLINLTEKRSQ